MRNLVVNRFKQSASLDYPVSLPDDTEGPARTASSAFTLLELLLAVSILSIVTAITYMTFSTTLNAWRRGTVMSDNIHHGDFVMEQLIAALRSAYYPDGGGKPTEYGFWLTDNGDGPYDSDVISWVKLGDALVGKGKGFAENPHRVKFSVETDDEGRGTAIVRSWRYFGQEEDFDPDALEAEVVSARVTGFNCRPAFPYLDTDGEVEWLDEWEETNKLPTALELTLYLEPLEEGDEPMEMKRVMGIPVGPKSGPWNRNVAGNK